MNDIDAIIDEYENKVWDEACKNGGKNYADHCIQYLTQAIKSNAAKQYWYEQFKAEQKQSINTSTINEAALEYAKNHSAASDKETPDSIITDFKAGAFAPETEQYYREKFKTEQKQSDDWKICGVDCGCHDSSECKFNSRQQPPAHQINP